MLQNWKVVEGDNLALDSTKVKGQNSLKNNFNQKKINRHLEYLEGKIDEYLNQLDQLKGYKKSQPKEKELENKIRNAEDRICYYEQMQERVDNSIDGQVSTSDPDARAVIKHRNIVEVGYNIQATVDAKHNIIVDVFAGGVTDRGDLGEAAKRSQDLLGVPKIDLLAD